MKNERALFLQALGISEVKVHCLASGSVRDVVCSLGFFWDDHWYARILGSASGYGFGVFLPKFLAVTAPVARQSQIKPNHMLRTVVWAHAAH